MQICFLINHLLGGRFGIFPARGRGKGSPGRLGWGRSVFFIEFPQEGGGPQELVCRNLGGGAKYFLLGPKFPPSMGKVAL